MEIGGKCKSPLHHEMGTRVTLLNIILSIFISDYDENLVLNHPFHHHNGQNWIKLQNKNNIQTLDIEKHSNVIPKERKTNKVNPGCEPNH